MVSRTRVLCGTTAVRLHPVLRRTASHTLVTLLSALVVVLPIPRAARRAHAQSGLFENASFTFADQNESAIEHGASSANGPALTVRTSPIGASGSYTRVLPIRVPPGRSGMTPSLALSYSSTSAHKTSAVGAGWSFGVPSISRSIEDGFPKLEGGLSYARYSNEAPFTGPSGRMIPYLSHEGLTPAMGASLLYSPVRETTPVRHEFSAVEDRWVEHLPSGVSQGR